MRWNVSDRAAAAIVNATLIDFGIISPDDTSCTVDRQKIIRAKRKCRADLNGNFLATKKSKYDGVFFDGKEISTLNVSNATGHHKNIQVKQEHTVLVSEPQSAYLGHVTTQGKTAKEISDALLAFLGTRDAIPDVRVLGADSTATNTGPHGGIIRLIEIGRGSKVHWSICMLHTNELPLRHLLEKKDGPTSGSNSFKGPVGKSLMKMDEWAWNPKFTPIKNGPELPVLPEKVLNDLSSDQKYLYLAASSIKTGKIDRKLLHLTPGPICHSRWLTTACRLMAAYMKKSSFDRKAKGILHTLVVFIVTNYVPCWFAIKLKPYIADASSHVLLAVQLLRVLPKTTQAIVAPYVKSWHAHPENLLVSLLSSENGAHRKFAVDKILELRCGDDEGDTSPRIFHPPALNLGAEDLLDLIDWNKEGLSESCLTCHLTIAEIEELRETPLQVPRFPSHTQAVERFVREMTDVSQRVAGAEARDGFIRARMASRAQYKKANTKRDFTLMAASKSPEDDDKYHRPKIKHP